jgi:F-type H+-transporting ATPase subunit b
MLLVILGIFVWRPVAEALHSREGFINDSLKAAELAKDEMKQLKAENEYLLQEARFERDKMLKEALTVATKIKEDAKVETGKIAERMIEDARKSIESEKQAAMKDVRNMVADLSLGIAEKVLRQKLSDDKSQKNLIEEYVKDINQN